MRYRPLMTNLIGWLASLVAFGSVAHPGGVDENGGHVNRATGEYHCHRPGCVLPTTTSTTSPASAHSGTISVASFNIQFLGNSKRRDSEALAAVLAPNDIVVVQELVAPPFPGAFPDGKPFKPDKESAQFFDAMTARGFDFVLSPEDTGTGNKIHVNSSATEWWVTFYKPSVVQVAPDLPSGFLASDRSNHPDFERVPFAFAFRSADMKMDFVLISVHLKPDAGAANAARRAHELAAIADWVNNNDNTEKDFIILGDMNLEDCDELAEAAPSGFASLNDTCKPTNTNVNGPKPYDHVLYRGADTRAVEMPRVFDVIDLVIGMRDSWQSRHTGTYPGNPYDHNDFRAVYSDHHPVVFRFTPVSDDD